MTSDTERVYSPDNKRRTELQEFALLAGITALHAAVTPVVMLGGVAKSISNGMSEKIRSKVASRDNKNYTTTIVTHRIVVQLPNQLLGDIVDVSRPENPLISEARRF